jgi:hypothetical protein
MMEFRLKKNKKRLLIDETDIMSFEELESGGMEITTRTGGKLEVTEEYDLVFEDESDPYTHL